MPTIVRAQILHTPRDPFAEGAGALEAFSDGGLAHDDAGRILATGPFAAVRAAHPDATVIDATRRGARPRSRRPARPLPAGRGHRRDGADPAGLAGDPHAARGGPAREHRLRARRGAGVRARPGPQRHDDRARLRLALRGRAGGAVHRGRTVRPADHERARAVRPQPPPRAARRAGRRATRRAGPCSSAGTAAAGCATPSRRGSRCRAPTRCWRSAARCSRTPPTTSSSPATSTRTRPRSRRWPSCSRGRATTWTPTSATGSWAAGRCSPTTST